MTRRFGPARAGLVPSALSLLALSLSASCSSSFEALGSDAGDVAMDDACVGCGEDADVRGDGGVSPDAGTCDLGWFPPDAPQYFDATALGRVRAAGRDQFYVGYLQGNPSPCDGPCGAALEVATDGTSSGVMPAYWSSLVGDPPPAIDVRRGDVVMLVDRPSATWQFRPLVREGWQNDGTFGATAGMIDGQRVVDLGLAASDATPAVVLLTVPPATDESGYHASLGIRVSTGGSVEAIESAFFDGVKDPQFVDGTNWIAALQNWDFPPTVQLANLAGSTDTQGSSCGVLQFHAVGLSDGSVAVVQDCFPEGGARRVELHGRAGSRGSATLTDRSSGVPPRAVRTLTSTDGSPFGIAVVFVEEGASAPSLVIVDSIEPGLWLTNPAVTLPTASGLTLPIASVDVAAADDGTLLVTWSGTPADPVDLWQWEGPEAAYATVRRCR
ncbi:MAG: hypothetical protein H6722_29965 [Sandaracinus sp.]|nr:hypothetical protein [Sandaracinus sp.]MCB9616683.1 hypothetical protein [Sandaracinus sp.]